MDNQFKHKKRFSEILDHTFQLCRTYFSPFFMIFLFLLGPVIILEAIFLINSGNSLIRQTGVGTNWFEQIINGYDDVLEAEMEGNSITSTLFSVLTLVGTAAILFAVQHIKNNEEFTPGSVIKKAFSRFGPIMGSSIILGIIAFIIIFITTFGGIFGGVTVGENSIAMGIVLGIFFFLVVFFGIAFLFTRWGFYMAIVTLKEGFPGFSQSWRLTKKNTWRVLGLFIIIFLITIIISTALSSLVGLVLGDSVINSVIVNIISLIMSMISSVAYAVVFFDLKLRQDGDDLQEMIDDYQND